MKARKENLCSTTLLIASQLLLPASLLGQSATTPEPYKEEIVTLGAFEVREQIDRDSYRATESISAAGISLPLAELPVPIQVVTSALLEDRGVTDMVDALTAIPGVSTNGPLISGQQSFIIRGYAAPGMRNGLRLGNDSTDSALIERIEVARGPTAVLYGSGATGGVVNRITKKPKFTQEGSLILSAGNFSNVRAMLDLTGPVPLSFLERDGNPTLAYRVVGEYRYKESDVDWYESGQTTLSGSLRWQPTDRIMFTAEASRVRRDRTLWVEIPVISVPGQGIVYNRDPTGRGYQFSIMGPDAYNDIEGIMYEFQATVQLTDNLTFHTIYGDYTGDTDGLRARNIDVWAATGNAQLEADAEHTYQRFWKANFLWDTRIGSVDSKMVFGYEWSTDHNIKRLFRDTWVPPADFTISEAVSSALFARNPNTRRDRDIDLEAFRLNHYLTALGERLHILWGVRRDEDVDETNRLTDSQSTLSGDTTYQVGAVYDLTKGVGLFVNYSTDFVANTQSGRDGEPLDPQSGNGYDIGFKFSALSNRLTGMISYFSTDRENIARRQDILDDPSTPDIDEKDSFFVLSGKEEASGVDFDLHYGLTDSWYVLVGGSFFDAETVSNVQDPAQVGLPPQDVVRSSLNFQTIYTFSSGGLKDWTFSVGGYWRDNFRTEGNANQINVQTDDHYILNAFARRKFEWRGHDVAFSVHVNNLLDRRGYIINGETFGPPLMAWASVRYDF